MNIEKAKKRLALLSLVALGSLAGNAFGANREAPLSALSPAGITSAEKARPLGNDLQELILSLDNPSHRVGKLIGMAHKELADYRAGKNRVRIIQIGGELTTGAVTKKDIATMKLNIKMFDDFARSGAQVNMPITEKAVDQQGRIYTKKIHSAHLAVPPRNKDRVVFVVPARIDIGKSPYGDPATFTHPGKKTAVSFVRPDYQDGQDGVITEACQASLKVHLTNEFDIFAYSLNDQQKRLADLAGQEMACNRLARLIHAQRRGWTYAQYERYNRKWPINLVTNDPMPEVNGYTFSVGALKKDAYSKYSVKTHIPKDIGLVPLIINP